MYERQVLRLGPVNQHQTGNRAKERKAKRERQERAGPVGPRWAPLGPEVGCLRLHRVTSVRPAWHRRSVQNTRVNILSFEASQKSSVDPLRRANLLGQISPRRLLFSPPRESRHVEPAFQKSTLMMLISRGPFLDSSHLEQPRDLAERFTARIHLPAATFDPMIYDPAKGLETINRASCSFLPFSN